MSVTVYTLSDSKSVRYVGITRHPEKRAKQRMAKLGKKRKAVTEPITIEIRRAYD